MFRPYQCRLLSPPDRRSVTWYAVIVVNPLTVWLTEKQLFPVSSHDPGAPGDHLSTGETMYVPLLKIVARSSSVGPVTHRNLSRLEIYRSRATFTGGRSRWRFVETQRSFPLAQNNSV